MRILFLLNPAFDFLYSYSHFPYSVYLINWIKENTNNSLHIASSSDFITDDSVVNQIQFEKTPQYDTRKFSLISYIRYRRTVFKLIRRIRPDLIAYDGLHTFHLLHNKKILNRVFLFPKNITSAVLIQSYNRSYVPDRSYYKNSLLYNRITNNKDTNPLKFLFSNEKESELYSSVPMVSHSIKLYAPELPASAFKAIDEDHKSLIKKNISNGNEYFICTANFLDPKKLIFLLKAYTLFKRRFRNNVKLLFTGLNQRFHSDLLDQILQYKYKEDLIILQPCNNFPYSHLLAAAYAHIFPSAYEVYPSGICETLQCAVPVILPNDMNIYPTEDNVGCRFLPDSIEALSQAMILIYRDELYRKTNIFESLKSIPPLQHKDKFYKEFVRLLQP